MSITRVQRGCFFSPHFSGGLLSEEPVKTGNVRTCGPGAERLSLSILLSGLVIAGVEPSFETANLPPIFMERKLA